MQNRAWCKSITSILEAMLLICLNRENPAVGSIRLVTRRGEDATQVQSTVEVCKRIGN